MRRIVWFFTRRMWGARQRRHHPGTLDAREVEGIALHWPGMSKPLPAADVKGALRSWQNLHMDTNGWSDIAYQGAIDQEGRYYRLRGLRYRSAANGDTDLNRRFGALLLILGPGEQPSAKMVKRVKQRIKVHRRLFPRSRKVVGHGEIRPGGTTCPGAAISAAIAGGWFEP